MYKKIPRQSHRRLTGGPAFVRSSSTPGASLCLFHGVRKNLLAAFTFFAVRNKGLTVRTLALSGVGFVRTYLNLVQHTVVGSLCMILALRNSARNTVIGAFVFHGIHNMSPGM